MKLAELRRPEVEAMDKTNKVAIVPLGSLEQHGEHLPLYTDSLLGGELARRVEAALPETVVLLPMQWIGSSHHHLKFPGTVSVPSSVYIEMIYHLCECLLGAGFRRIYLLLSHGGNDVPCREVLNRLSLARRDEADKFWIASGGYWTLAAEAMRLPEMETPGATHACEYETSMVLSVRPDLVDLDRAISDCFQIDSRYYDPASPGKNRIHVAQPFEHLTRTGALGRPEAATPEKGERLFAAVVDELVAFVREFSTWERKSKANG
jgi:creatinine amidohydrolase